MVHLIHHFPAPLQLVDGREFVVRLFGAPQPSGTMWDGWLVFFPVGRGAPLVGDRETSQTSLQDLAYWASGLEPVFLEGALDRAERMQGRPLVRRHAWGHREAEVLAHERAAYDAVASEWLETPPTPT